MNLSTSNIQTFNWHQQANEALVKGNYFEAIKLYETAIETEPDQQSYYWELGLLLLLDGKEEEAQTTWLFAMSDGTETEVEEWTEELLKVLDREAKRREKLQDDTVAWVIRQHIREINPTDVTNILRLIELSIKTDNYNGEEIISDGFIELLESDTGVEVDSEILMETLRRVLDYNPLDLCSLKLTKACVSHVKDKQAFIRILVKTAFKVSVVMHIPALSAKFAEIGLELEPENLEIWLELATVYQNSGDTDKGIEAAKKSYFLSENLPERLFANYMILRGLMFAGRGNSEEVKTILKRHESLFASLFELQPMDLTQGMTMRLFSTAFFFPYLRDEPKINRYYNQEVAKVCQNNILRYTKNKLEELNQQFPRVQNTNSDPKTLKIGYLSSSLRTHSVGWLSRWLFQYHNKDKFEVHAYLINSQGRNDELQNWFINNVYKSYLFYAGSSKILDQIHQDNLDILVDLDSITLDVCCEIMAIKHAPVQVTWLGWDASGLPSIDYFIADPYVLPKNAQDYYTETIWRLPQTYLAVDGFEVGVPTVRRDTLDIPSDAVIYLSSQSGYKYNFETARLQMQILKEVPNSYFLIKDLVTDAESVKARFSQIAEEVGVSPDRLRQMPMVPTSSIHRANLGIADVFLDTYPYNGATTTMENLWMCVPMVTRVGQQFAARNSYTMMINAGITEGIAWSDEEYVEWGIRLGKDEKLRQEISWKLRKSRQTAPLWNAKQFTREMENAYEEMWQRYLDN